MRSITPAFETHGKRRRLVGFRATIDGYELPGLFGSYLEAERAIDAYVYETLRRAA